MTGSVHGPGPPPRRIDGRYTILNRLGKGSMGVVYRAHDDQMGRDVALKVMMTDAEGDEIAVERFLREARAMGRLLHRNIVTVFNMGDEAGRYYIVMELLEGCTLSEWIKTGGHALEEKVELMLQACDGLSVAHSAGIIHRDVKPNNLFVQVDGTLKIVDFGIARLATSSMTRSGLILGTPHYMSPEQARGTEVDCRSDVFSAAAVFYLMLSGRKPFDGADLPVVLHRVVHDDPPPLTEADAPPALARIVLKALKKAPDQRYQTVAEFVADLARFKRQFDGETRRLMTAAEGRFDALRRAVETSEELRTTLGVSGSSTLPSRVAGLATRFPTLGQSRAVAVPGIASGRDEALSVAAAVSEIASTADEELAQLAALQDAMTAAEGALGAGDARQALEVLRLWRPTLEGVTCGPFDTLLAKAQKRLAKQQVQADYAKTLLDQARAAEAAGQWRVAAQCANEALLLRANVKEAQALLDRVTQAEADAAIAKAQRTRRLFEQAEAAMAAGRYDQADQVITQLTEIDPSDERLTELIARRDSAREMDARLAAETREAAELLASARAAFADGHRDSAIAALADFARSHPTLPAVADQLQKFRDAVERLAAEASRAAAVRRGQAAAFARKAIVALACGRYTVAEAEARRAVALDAERADAAKVLVDAPRLALEERADAERGQADIRRAREVDQLIRDVRLYLRSGDYPRAAWAAERANELDPSRAGVSIACSRSRAVLAALRAGSRDGVAVVAHAEPGQARSPWALQARASWSFVQRCAEDAQAAGRRLGWQVFRVFARGRRA